MLKKFVVMLTAFLIMPFAVEIPSFSAETLPVKLETVNYVSAGHILVKTRPEALALKKRIDNGEKFEDLAKAYSLCPSGQRGGVLGSFGRGQMVKSFENAAFNLPVGQVSEPVKTEFGWHLIKVYDRKR
ncbi:MAG: peptidylprolyl isomerase [Candidatus Gastranaerophilaceae bacterium]